MLGMVRDNKKTYYFRLRVPKDVAPYFPCRELKKKSEDSQIQAC